MSENDALDKIKKLVDDNADKRMKKIQDNLDKSKDNEAALQARIKDLENELSRPKVDEHAASAKAHSERARNAIRENEATRRELIIASRKIDALQKASTEKDATIEDLSARLSTCENLLAAAQVKLPVDRPVNTRIRRSQRIR